MKKIKIFHIISSFRRGGRERQLATIATNTDFDNYHTRIIVFNNSTNSYIEEYDLQDHIIKLSSRKFLQRLFELHQLIKKYQPDVVYTWGTLESFFALLLCSFHRFSFINGSIRHGIRSRQFSHYFRTLILHLSQHVVANSHAGLKANNLKRGFVLYNGIDDKFLIPLPDRSAKRKELINISDSKIVFISVANLVPYKDYHTVISAMALLKKAYPDFHYLILGDGPMRNQIEDVIHKSGLENHVTILGNVENVHEFLKISDIFIHSSKGEGCSNAILEAMAAGLPVIATDTGGTPEIVSWTNGLLFPFKDIGQLLVNIKTLVAGKKLARKMGKCSGQIIKHQFSIQIMMKNYCKILNEICFGKSSQR